MICGCITVEKSCDSIPTILRGNACVGDLQGTILKKKPFLSDMLVFITFFYKQHWSLQRNNSSFATGPIKCNATSASHSKLDFAWPLLLCRESNEGNHSDGITSGVKKVGLRGKDFQFSFLQGAIMERGFYASDFANCPLVLTTYIPEDSGSLLFWSLQKNK